jgi:hypothetical protein
MGTHNTLTDEEATAILGQMADNLNEAQDELGRVMTGRLSPEDIKRNTAHAAVAQAHTLQAVGVGLYLLLSSRLGE